MPGFGFTRQAIIGLHGEFIVFLLPANTNIKVIATGTQQVTTPDKLQAGQRIGTKADSPLVGIFFAWLKVDFKVNTGWVCSQFTTFNDLDILKITRAPQIQPEFFQ